MKQKFKLGSKQILYQILQKIKFKNKAEDSPLRLSKIRIFLIFK